MRRSQILLTTILLVCACGDDGGTAQGEGEGASETGEAEQGGAEQGGGGADQGGGGADQGDQGDGDGDGDGEPGDGDGEPGDGDGEPGDGDGEPGDGDGEPGDGDGEPGDGDGEPEPLNPLLTTSNLWYTVEDRLHYIEIDTDDGSVVQLVSSTITTPMINGQSGITMLQDGSLLISRESALKTDIYHVAEPPTEASVIEVELLGSVPDGLWIEALYTDCQGLVYLMDTGVDVVSAEGNRLLRFTGDYLAGDLSYEIITDLEQASVADIDDMSPGIDAMGQITDGLGLAIDSGQVYEFDYNTGTGSLLGSGGTWGIHALGGPLFSDNVARLYLMDSSARLYEADPVSLALSPVLVTGPTPNGNVPSGWSGLAGPLTECETTLPEPQ